MKLVLPFVGGLVVLPMALLVTGIIAETDPWLGYAFPVVVALALATRHFRHKNVELDRSLKRSSTLNWLFVSAMAAGLGAAISPPGSAWQGLCVVGMMASLIALYALDRQQEALKSSWLQRSKESNGLLSDGTDSLDCYPDVIASSGSSTDGAEQNHHVQASVDHVRASRHGGATDR
jgi:hypothetical protein